MANKLKALIIGGGYVGERHAKAQKRLGNETAVYDIRYENVQNLVNQLGITGFADVEKALQWSNVVHICTPDNLHTEIAARAIQSGKNVLCEKPMVTSVKDALYLEKLVYQYKTKFIVGNNYRLSPAFYEIYKRVRKNKIGKLLSIHTTYLHDMRKYHKKTPWRLHQNFLYGGGIHAIDLACWIANEKVIAVDASVGKKVMTNYDQPEDYQIVLTFLSGLTAHIWLNARIVLPMHKTDVEVYGEKGTFIANNKSGVLKYFNPRIKKNDFITETFRVGYRQTIPKEIEIANRYFLRGNKIPEPLVNIHVALKEIQVLDAIERSIVSKKRINL